MFILKASFTGNPSITYRGSLFPTIEFVPLILILTGAPGEPLFALTCTPAALPDKACIRFADGTALISLLETEDIEPVISDFLTIP